MLGLEAGLSYHSPFCNHHLREAMMLRWRQPTLLQIVLIVVTLPQVVSRLTRPSGKLVCLAYRRLDRRDQETIDSVPQQVLTSIRCAFGAQARRYL